MGEILGNRDKNGRRSDYKKIMSYDDVLDEIGEFGRFQALSIALLWVTATVPGIHVLMHALTGYEPSNGYRCKIDGCDEPDWEYQDNLDLVYEGDYCKNYPHLVNSFNQTCYRNLESSVLEKCTANSEYRYNEFEFTRTFVTRFNLVCPENYKVALVGSIYMAGLMIGSSTAGFISDAFGRRKALLFCILVSSTGSLVGTFMPEYWSYTVLRFITAIGSVGLFNESFTLTVELLGNKEKFPCIPFITQKSFYGNTIQIPYAIGGALLGLTAYFVRDYVTLQLCLSCAVLVQIPIWFFVPESPRWLISKNRQEEAKKLILKLAKINKKQLDLDDVELLPAGENSSGTNTLGFKDLFRTKDVRLISIVMLTCWPITSLGYYGLGLSMTQLGGNIFVSFILGALVEIPGYFLCTFTIDIMGRKPFFFWCFMISGVACIVSGLLETGPLRTGLALAGKMFAAGNFSVIYMYTAELYPTVIRNTAIGACSNTARLGGILAPPLALYFPKIQRSLPMLVMGGSSIIGGLLALFLPETLGNKLPETIQEITNMKENSKSFWSCKSSTKEEEEK